MRPWQEVRRDQAKLVVSLPVKLVVEELVPLVVVLALSDRTSAGPSAMGGAIVDD